MLCVHIINILYIYMYGQKNALHKALDATKSLKMHVKFKVNITKH